MLENNKKRQKVIKFNFLTGSFECFTIYSLLSPIRKQSQYCKLPSENIIRTWCNSNHFSRILHIRIIQSGLYIILKQIMKEFFSYS